ncbi:TetR/AcrR family transcriptional regulator [Streptomonospora nanhaiensis]|uniref:TetR/AcrR family transcriptional regulator n=1 Tax=Streptomonospora nanhaiensis TaxID=1323731 RepID=UPI001C995ACE|nr:TetR/AcrR family transcriptional regulator [Streptomonospora nanhaiensis]MBX9391409.1 TetR/AcrR family transcriptional regulator [Streptomonospora nanhaiensis]
MPRARSSETRERIQAAALDLFSEQGVQRTSLREIAERLGLTKPALYYHFPSREELVRSLVQPLIDEIEELISRDEAAGATDPRALLGGYFDASCRHRRVTALVARELATLSYLDLGARVMDWRRRLIALLAGPDADLTAQSRAVTAIGGLSDCLVFFGDADPRELRPAVLTAALSALGVENPEGPEAPPGSARRRPSERGPEGAAGPASDGAGAAP